MHGMSRMGRLTLNELIKLWAHRRIHILCVAAFGAVLSIAGILGSGHSGSWKDSARSQIASLRQVQAQLAQSAPPGGMPGGINVAQALDDQIALEQLLLDRNIAPIDWYPVSSAAKAVFQGGFPFYLLLFGWLAAEMIAHERSERTIYLVLSRPVARHEIVLAKALALWLVSLAVLVAGLLAAYILDGVARGGWDSFNANVLLVKDPSQPAIAANILVLPAWAYLLASMGLSMLAVMVAEGLGLIASAVSRSSGPAILITLGSLLVLPTAAVGVSVGLHLWWVKYGFFANLQPASLLTDRANPFLGGSSPLLSGFVLAAWAVVFYAGCVIVFRRRDEA